MLIKLAGAWLLGYAIIAGACGPFVIGNSLKPKVFSGRAYVRVVLMEVVPMVIVGGYALGWW